LQEINYIVSSLKGKGGFMIILFSLNEPSSQLMASWEIDLHSSLSSEEEDQLSVLE